MVEKPKMLAANWKMNTDLQDGIKLANDVNKYVKGASVDEKIRIVLAVPFTHITEVVHHVDYRRISVAAQNCSEHEKGAYTGEVSADMIKSTGAHYVIIGHSERRHIYKEENDSLAEKVNLCLKNALRPIFCVGEKLDERNDGRHKDVVLKQLKDSLFQIDNEDLKRSVIAYEPVWAIGTGETATPEQAQEMHEFIRNAVSEAYPDVDADIVPILYGGSVKPANAKELFDQKDINGGLVGGASLKADLFTDILKSF